jgi:hypothetical protein
MEMLDALRILFCGLGAVYLGIRLIRSWRALAGGRCLRLFPDEPARHRNASDLPPAWRRRDAVTSTAERASVSSR